MKTFKRKNKVMVVLPYDEAKEKNLDDCETIILDKLRKEASKRNWNDISIEFDADDNQNFVYTVKECIC